MSETNHSLPWSGTFRRHLSAGCVLFTAVLMSGCGGDENTPGSSPNPVPIPSPTPSPAPSPTPSPTSDDLGVPDICKGDVADAHGQLDFTVSGASIAIAPDRPIAGVNFRAFITSNPYALARSRQTDDDASFYRQSYQATFIYGQSEIDAVKSWGATTVRFQISQTLTAAGDASYRQCITNAVRQARNSGLAVVLAMQWQKNENPSGLNRGMPTDLTLRAWRNVDALFRNDDGIAYELFNEPVMPLYPDGRPQQLLADFATRWNIWRDGDASQPNPQGYIGHQQLVTFMRTELRTDKLLVADGLDLGDSFEGLPVTGMLSDPRGRLAYAVHPYARGFVFDTSAAQFDGYTRRWGFMRSRNVPLFVTEWAQGAQDTDATGRSVGFRLARDLVNYANGNGIPLVASAFDVNGPINTGLVPRPTGNVFSPSNFDAWFDAGRQAGSGAGILLCRFLRRGYRTMFSYGDADLRSARLPGEAADSPCLRSSG